MVYKISNIFLDNCSFLSSLNVYLLKTRHYNKNMNKLFIFFNKAKRVIVNNTFFALFLFKRSLFFIIELVYNKGYIFIINTLFSDSYIINKKLIFFKYYVNLFNNSLVNGFITNSSYLFKYLFNKVNRKQKISKRILQKFIKKSLNKLVINNKTKDLIFVNHLNILNIFKKKKKKILFKYLKKFKKKYKLKKRVKLKLIKKLKKIINKKLVKYKKIFIKIKEQIYEKYMSNFQINKILKIYLKNIKKLLKLELNKDKSYLVNTDLLNYNSRRNIRIKLNTKKISKNKRKKIKILKLIYKYKRFLKKKYKENFIYIKQLKTKKNSMTFGSLYTRIKNKKKSYFFNKKIRKKKGNKNLNKKNKSILFKLLFKNILNKYNNKLFFLENNTEKVITKRIKINILKKFSMEIFFLIRKKKLLKDYLSIILFRKNKLKLELIKLKKISKILYKYFLLYIGKIHKLVIFLNIYFFQIKVKNFLLIKQNKKNIFSNYLMSLFESFIFLKESRILRYNLKKKQKKKEIILEIFLLLLFNNKVNKTIQKNLEILIKKKNNKLYYFYSLLKKENFTLSFFLDLLDFFEDLEINYKIYNLMLFDLKKLIKGEFYVDTLILKKLFKIYIKIKNKRRLLEQNEKKKKKIINYFWKSNPILKNNNKFNLILKNIKNFKINLKIKKEILIKEEYKKKIIKKINIKQQKNNSQNFKIYLYNKFKNEMIQNFSIYLFDIFNLYNKIQNLQIKNNLVYFKDFNFLNYFKKNYISLGNSIEIFLEKYVLSSDFLSIFFEDVTGKEIKKAREEEEEEKKKEEEKKEEKKKQEEKKKEEEKKEEEKKEEELIKEEKILDDELKKEEEKKEEEKKKEEARRRKEEKEKKREEELIKEEKILDDELKKEEEALETVEEIILKLKIKQIKNKVENTFKNIYINNNKKNVIDNLKINQKFINELLFILGLKKGFFNFFEIFINKSINKTLIFNSLSFVFNFYNNNLESLNKNLSNFNNFKLFSYFLNNIFRIILIKLLKLEIKKDNFNNLSLNMSKFFLIKLDNFMDKDFIKRELQRLKIKVKDNNENLLDMGTRRKKFKKIKVRILKNKKNFSEFNYVPNPEIEKYKEKWFKDKRKEFSKLLGQTEEEWLKEEEIYEEEVKKAREEDNKKLEKLEKKKKIKQKKQLLKKKKFKRERKKKKIDIEVSDKTKVHNIKYFPRSLSNNLNIKINKYFKDSFYFFENINFKFFIYFTFEYLKNNHLYFFSQNLDLKHFIFFNYYDNLRDLNLKKNIYRYRTRPRVRRTNKYIDNRFKNKYFISNKLKKIIKHKIFSKSDIKKLKNINKIFGFLIRNSKYNVTNKFQFFDLFVKNKQIINRIKYFFKFKKIKIKINNLHHHNNLNDVIYKNKRVHFYKYRKQRIPDSLIILDSYSNISSILVECDLFNIPIIKFINPEEFNLIFDYPIPISINNKSQIFFLNFFLRITFIGYKKFLYKINSLKSNYNKSKYYIKDLKNVY